MEPITAITLLTTLIGLGLSLAGQAEESKGAQSQAKENERLAKLAAADALQRGGREAGYTRMAGAQLLSEQKVAAAVSGADPTVGTPAQVQAGSRALVELEARTQENNAAREAWGFKKHGLRYRDAVEREGRALGYRQAGTILGSVGRLGSTLARDETLGAKLTG